MEIDGGGVPVIQVGIVSSCGGHLTEVRRLLAAYERYDHFYVLNDRVQVPPDMVGKTYFVAHSERDWRFFINLIEAWRLLRNEQPSVLLSTGAGPIVPFALIGKLLRIPTVFIESWTRVATPSLTGRIMYHLADRFFYQWPQLERYFPNGVYAGPVV